MPHVGIGPEILTPAAQTITQHTKCARGKTPRVSHPQNQADGSDGGEIAHFQSCENEDENAKTENWKDGKLNMWKW